MYVYGLLSLTEDLFATDFNIDVVDPGTAYSHEQSAAVELDALHRFGDDDFRFSISESQEPADINQLMADDQREIAEYKAEAVKLFAATAHLRPFGEAMVVESCPEQARRTAELSRAMVVCPATKAVFG